MNHMYELNLTDRCNFSPLVKEALDSIPRKDFMNLVAEYHADDRATFFLWQDTETGEWRVES